MAVARSDMRTRVLRRADMETSSFVSTAEVNQYIQASYEKLYYLLVQKFEDMFLDDPTAFTIASGAYTYTLPADFYKLVGVDESLGGGRWRPIKQYDWNRRNSSLTYHTSTRGLSRVRYRLQDGKLRFAPVENAPGDYRLWYIPLCQTMDDDADTLTGITPWEEYVEIDAAIKCLDKEETDSSALQRERALIKKDIEEQAQERDMSQPQRIQDVYAEGDWEELD